jgi:hypothetical protein
MKGKIDLRLQEQAATRFILGVLEALGERPDDYQDGDYVDLDALLLTVIGHIEEAKQQAAPGEREVR